MGARSRTGFTLVELLVAVAIIALLMTLMLCAIQQVTAYVGMAQCLAEIRQLEDACERFKQHYGRFPPSLIRLREPGNYHVHPDDPSFNLLDLYSKDYLEAIFRGIRLTDGHDWNGDGQIDSAGSQEGVAGYILQGHECLVYFLGGLPKRLSSSEVTVIGFYPAKDRPTAQDPPGSTIQRPRVSFFEFDRTRLVMEHGSHEPFPGSTFWPIGSPDYIGQMNVSVSYLDRWGTPYAYFLAGDHGRKLYLDNYYGTPACHGYVGPHCEKDVDGRDNDRDTPATYPNWPTSQQQLVCIQHTLIDDLNDCPAICWDRFIPYFEANGLPSPKTQQQSGGAPVWPRDALPAIDHYPIAIYWVPHTPPLPPSLRGNRMPPCPAYPFSWHDLPPPGTKFHNPKTFQIISAGRDGKFGVGGPCPLPNPGANDLPGEQGKDYWEHDRDNLTNFFRNKLELFGK